MLIDGDGVMNMSTDVFTNPMYDMMAIYMKQHSIHALKRETSDQICSRRFVIGKMNCNGMGNGNNQYLDNFLWAAIFNRTFVAHIFGQNTCQDYIGPKHWIVNDSALVHILNQHQCPMPREQQKELFSDGNTQIGLGEHSNTEEGIKNVRCCRLLEEKMKNMRFISPGMYPMGKGWRFTFETFHGNPDRRRIFSNETVERFLTLTNFNQYPNDPARGYATNGHLAIMSVRFSDSVKDLTKDTLSYIYNLPSSTFLNNDIDDGDDLYQYTDLRLKWPSNRLIFGYHGRHQFENIHREYRLDNFTIKCLFHDMNHTLNNIKYFNGYKRCTILITTDRPHTIDSVSIIAKREGCDLRFVDRKFITQQKNEHGPWAHPTSELSKADTYLVSHSNYFIGVRMSTFSMFIANYVAARSEIAHYFHNMSNVSNEVTMNQSFPFHTPHHIWNVNEVSGKCSSFLDEVIRQKCNKEIPFRNGRCGESKWNWNQHQHH